MDKHGLHVDLSREPPMELHIFLGHARFYHRFVLGFYHIYWPLS
jgi:hypothetical protein